MDTLISRQSFGLLWLNPPYGDLSKDVNGSSIGYQGQGRARLEKLFYQRALPLLQYGGVLIFIVPSYVLDAELVGWLTRHFADLRIYRAVETQFKQVVIFGRRVRQRDGRRSRPTPCAVCCCRSDRVTPKPRNCRSNGRSCRTPSCQPGRAGALLSRDDGASSSPMKSAGYRTLAGARYAPGRRAAIAASTRAGLVALASRPGFGRRRDLRRSEVKSGRVLVVKGDTHKEKTLQTEYTERDDGSVAETRILTDKFVPVIRAWDLTLGSPTWGEVLTIR